ncbi:tRNA (adenosine(37)-N6)-threonylcarbamoyltransferase complex ATPase subunit type 1 TsaE [Lichenihabitans psoromatis]|uniref:tRNA (adenosine(37)-N6)-threonylcarbamoyltransferase complex ATPase subunit type 1 TsaE n=1 Tax=Lichenihabitans psoromatis TaxID=2528642 RepID=UPI0010384370|nr:tRNA (adenosine(37)-N6)-threonylcarbamoyltransferase complex ATPase subunit type 1 TsaE [Lichenihabitans psoromatis]
MTETGAATRWQFVLRDETVTVMLASKVAGWVKAGDLLTLSGDLGAGKSTFARALIRELTNDPTLDVPSPTFTLVQVYDGRAFPIVHADLYRIETVDELAELGWDEAADGALVIVEWADRIGNGIAPDRLDLQFSIPADADPRRRDMVMTGYGRFAPRLGEIKAIEDLLPEAGFDGAARRYMTGDASTRAYERLTRSDGRTAVLMISPPRADAPVVRYGKPYHLIAQLAADIRPFIAIDKALRQQGISAPEIYAANIDAGLAVLEDLGSEPCVTADGPIAERYLEAVGLLGKLHGATLPTTVPIDDATPYQIPPYDLDALLIEAELMIDWYAPQIAKVAVSASARATFLAIYTRLLQPLIDAPATWCLRDVHSPNLIWLPDRRGTARIGIVDFQDCVMGHPAYDVAALLQDARVTVPDALELRLLGAYAQMRKAADPRFDMAGFIQAYAVMGVQRATKILGIFARLDKRDRKPQYLENLPRIEAYLAKGLAHPALAELKAWFEAYVPRALGAERS